MSLIPGATTVTPAPSTIKVNGKDVPTTEKVHVPAQQSKAEAMMEGLMKQLAEAKAELAEAKARAESLAKANAPKALQFKVSEKGAVQVNGLGRFPTTLYWQQWLRVIMAATGMSEQAFWTTPMGKFIIDNRTTLSTKGE